VSAVEGERPRSDVRAPVETSWDLPSLLRLQWLRLPEGLDPRSRPARLALAIGLALAAVGLRYLGEAIFAGDLGYVTYVAAVALSAWLGGLSAGLLTTAICGVVNAALFAGAGGFDLFRQPLELVRLIIFFADGFLISAITSALRRLSYREHQGRSASTDQYLAERDAHDRAEASRTALERLQTVTGTLTQAATPLEVAEVTLDRGLSALGAAAGGVSRVSDDGSALETIATRGYPPQMIQPELRYPLDTPGHLSHAVKTRTPVLIPNQAAWRARFPDNPARSLDAGPQPEAALAIVPLLSKDRTLGALVFRFEEARDFEDGTGELILRLADQCAQALDRAIAYEEQQLALGALERGNSRLDFLAQASELLGATREPDVLLAAVAQLAIRGVADWCVIELFDADRPSIAVAHSDPAGAARLRELASIAPQNLAAWLAPSADTQAGEFLDEAAGWRDRMSSPRAVELLDDLGARSWLVAPIVRDKQWVGAVTLGAASADRFVPTDLAMAQDLAARIATTLERSSLYGTVSRFKTTVDASLDAVYMFDPRSLQLTYINRGAAQLAGAEASELVGISVLELQPQFTRSELRAQLQPLLTGEVPSIGYTGMLARRDGRDTPIDALLQCVRLPDGSVTLVLTARDVTDRIEVQARLSRVATNERRRAAELNAILEAMREGVLVMDDNGIVRMTNAAALDICGSSPETLGQLAASLGVKEAALPAAGADAEAELIELPDGRWIEVSTYSTLAAGVLDGAEQAATIVVLRDVTRSREAAQAQEAFMGVLSHELRTPVTSIYGYAKVLQRPGLREQSTEMLEDIEAEADRLYRIVEDLLALSRVQAGFTVEGEPLLLQHLIGPLIKAEAQRWPQVIVEKEVPSDLPTIFGERTYVEQVLRNLLSNAAKYSPAGSTVTVTGRTHGDQVEIRVLDRGAGISAGEAEQLFRLFYRSPNTAKQASGAGIGLYVCRGLVQAMGGRIWATVREGGGSEFGFSLPVVEMELDTEDDA
jgi:PAS domain S-box-containing protein